MALSLLGGILSASFTHIRYPCGPRCVAYAKAIVHPADLLTNVQGSLHTFSYRAISGFAVCLLLALIFKLVGGLRRGPELENSSAER